MRVIVRPPELSDEKRLHDYVREHENKGETDITASAGLENSSFAEWVAKISKTFADGEKIGGSLIYLCFDGDVLVGMLDVRPWLERNARDVFGDIGYGVRPEMRGKGYATQILHCALDICRDYGMKDAIIGCFRHNRASERVIIKNGGKLLRECDSYKKGVISRYYIITL